MVARIATQTNSFASDPTMSTDSPFRSPLSRRIFLVNASGTAAITFGSPAIYSRPHAQRTTTAFETIRDLGQANKIQLSQIMTPQKKTRKLRDRSFLQTAGLAMRLSGSAAC